MEGDEVVVEIVRRWQQSREDGFLLNVFGE